MHWKNWFNPGFDWILQVCFREIKVLWDWALESSLQWYLQWRLSSNVASTWKPGAATTVPTWLHLTNIVHDTCWEFVVTWRVLSVALQSFDATKSMLQSLSFWGEAYRNNCSFWTEILPYTVFVGICVVKARWDSASGDDEITTSITVQQQPLAAVPRLG